MQVTITLIATGFGSREGDDAALASYMDRRSGAGQAKAPVVEWPDIPPQNIPQSPPPPIGGGCTDTRLLEAKKTLGPVTCEYYTTGQWASLYQADQLIIV